MMMKRLTVAFAIAVIVTFVFVDRNALAQANSKAVPEPQIPDSSGLSARLTNAIVRADNSIELDFVLFNSSSVPIRLAERWNSWGARQWELLVVDAKGKTYKLTNPETVWTRNYLSLFTIRPLEEQVTRCRLDMTTTSHSERNTEIFTLSDIDTLRINTWVFPVTVTGTFSASSVHHGIHGESNWKGTIRTKPLIIEESSKIPNPSPARAISGK